MRPVPPDRVADPSTVPPSRTCTVPVGVVRAEVTSTETVPVVPYVRSPAVARTFVAEAVNGSPTWVPLGVATATTVYRPARSVGAVNATSAVPLLTGNAPTLRVSSAERR